MVRWKEGNSHLIADCPGKQQQQQHNRKIPFMVQSRPFYTHSQLTHEPEPIYRCCVFFFVLALHTSAHMNTSKRKILRDGIPQQKACVGWRRRTSRWSSLRCHRTSLDCKISFEWENSSRRPRWCRCRVMSIDCIKTTLVVVLHVSSEFWSHRYHQITSWKRGRKISNRKILVHCYCGTFSLGTTPE